MFGGRRARDSDGGGEIIATGTPEDVAEETGSLTERYLKGMLYAHGSQPQACRRPAVFLQLRTLNS